MVYHDVRAATNSLRFIVAGLRTARLDHGGITDAQGVSMVRYGTSTTKDDSATESFA